MWISPTLCITVSLSVRTLYVLSQKISFSGIKRSLSSCYLRKKVIFLGGRESLVLPCLVIDSLNVELSFPIEIKDMLGECQTSIF